LQVDSAEAELAQAKAEQLALDAQVQQANQRLAEAKRNLNNTALFSSFPGQVTEIHAVPGTYVKEGDPIVTVQMVDPMLVEFEVTAANSRRYQRGDALGVSIQTPDGQQRELTGMVYTVDTIADVNTRTFTVSLHVRNESESGASGTLGRDNMATTANIFPLNLGPIVTGDQRLLVERNAIHKMGDEDFVWKVTNRSWSQLSYSKNRELTVERLKVKMTSDVIPFLGTWNFVAIEFEDPSKVDLNQDLITDKLTFPHNDSAPPTDLSTWTGDRVLLEQTRWMLRAGDTVSVALIPESSSKGFYVPMKAVRRENGKTFIHVVDDQDPQPVASSTKTKVSAATNQRVAKRVFVNVTADDSVAGDTLMLRIEPVTIDQLKDGDQVVVGGTHYLDEGDRVRVVPGQRASEGGR
jgi:multidrug efflux pump subunit AcrA (membrane-fusion protein)